MELLIVVHPSRVDPDLPAFDVLVKGASKRGKRRLRELLSGFDSGPCRYAERFVREGYEYVGSLDMHHTFDQNARVIHVLMELARRRARLLVVVDAQVETEKVVV